MSKHCDRRDHHHHPDRGRWRHCPNNGDYYCMVCLFPRDPVRPPGQGSYSSAHMRRKRVDGPARNWTCVDCGSPAAHWALDHTAPIERLMVDVHSVRAGGAFSTAPADYRPKCAACNNRDGAYLRKSELYERGQTTRPVLVGLA